MITNELIQHPCGNVRLMQLSSDHNAVTNLAPKISNKIKPTNLCNAFCSHGQNMSVIIVLMCLLVWLIYGVHPAAASPLDAKRVDKKTFFYFLLNDCHCRGILCTHMPKCFKVRSELRASASVWSG